MIAICEYEWLEIVTHKSLRSHVAMGLPLQMWELKCTVTGSDDCPFSCALEVALETPIVMWRVHWIVTWDWQ